MPTAKPTLKLQPSTHHAAPATSTSHRKPTPRAHTQKKSSSAGTAKSRQRSSAATGPAGRRSSAQGAASSIPETTVFIEQPTGSDSSDAIQHQPSSPEMKQEESTSSGVATSSMDPSTDETAAKVRPRTVATSLIDPSTDETAAKVRPRTDAMEAPSCGEALPETFAARLAHARLERQRARRSSAGSFQHPESSSSSRSSSDRTDKSSAHSWAASSSRAAGLQAELDRLRADRAARTAKLLASLDELSKSSGASLLSALVPVNQETSLVAAQDGDGGSRRRRDPQTGGALIPHESRLVSVDGGEHPLVPYTGLAEDSSTAEARTILRMFRSRESRRWLRQWLSEGGRAARVRAVIETAPEALRQALVDVLLRLLSEEEDMDASMLMPQLLITGDDAAGDRADGSEGGPLLLRLADSIAVGGASRLEEL